MSLITCFLFIVMGNNQLLWLGTCLLYYKATISFKHPIQSTCLTQTFLNGLKEFKHLCPRKYTGASNKENAEVYKKFKHLITLFSSWHLIEKINIFTLLRDTKGSNPSSIWPFWTAGYLEKHCHSPETHIIQKFHPLKIRRKEIAY